MMSNAKSRYHRKTSTDPGRAASVNVEVTEGENTKLTILKLGLLHLRGKLFNVGVHQGCRRFQIGCGEGGHDGAATFDGLQRMMTDVKREVPRLKRGHTSLGSDTPSM